MLRKERPDIWLETFKFSNLEKYVWTFFSPKVQNNCTSYRFTLLCLKHFSVPTLSQKHFFSQNKKQSRDWEKTIETIFGAPAFYTKMRLDTHRFISLLFSSLHPPATQRSLKFYQHHSLWLSVREREREPRNSQSQGHSWGKNSLVVVGPFFQNRDICRRRRFKSRSNC